MEYKTEILQAETPLLLKVEIDKFFNRHNEDIEKPLPKVYFEAWQFSNDLTKVLILYHI
jgi:hypothetical protein